MENEQNQKNNKNLLYLLLLLVLGLLGSTIYYASQKNKVEQKIIVVTDQKAQVQAEVDRLTQEIQLATSNMTKLTGEMKEKEKEYLQKLSALRTQLTNASGQKLAKLRKELAALKADIDVYLSEIAKLKKENKVLTGQRDSLKVEVDMVTEKVGVVERENQVLNNKNAELAKAAAALKATNIVTQVLKVKKSGKEVEVTKAKKANKIKLDFKIHPNNLAKEGEHEVFVQILDGTGKVLEGISGGKFEAEGKELTYTNKVMIDYTSGEKNYTLNWTSTLPFAPGDYSIILYSDGFLMGKAKFTLK